MDAEPHDDLVKRIDMVGEHLQQQDNYVRAVHQEMRDGFAKVDERFKPLESIATSLDEIVRLAQALRRATVKAARWLVLAVATGALFEIGKTLVDRGFFR